MHRLPRLLRPALLVAVLAFVTSATVLAAGSATIRDDAGLFTSAGRSAIERAAEQNDVRVVVITNNQNFRSPSLWHAWLRGQATDPNAITIGLHAVPRQKNVYVVPGANTGISQGQAAQGVRDTLRTFDSAGPAEGVIQLIQDYHSMGATAPSGSEAPAGGGLGWGWVVPVIIVALLAFVLLRLLRGRRRATPDYGPYNQSGPYNQYGGPYQGYGPGFGGGGGFGRGLLGGLLGGLGGAWLGNQLFGDRGGGGGDVNAGAPDASQGGPLDTSTAQSMPGEWTGDGGDAGQTAGGDWSGNGGDSGWDSGGNGGGDGGWGGDGGGDGGGWT